MDIIFAKMKVTQYETLYTQRHTERKKMKILYNHLHYIQFQTPFTPVLNFIIIWGYLNFLTSFPI